MALWGNKDLVYSDGTISVNFTTKTVEGATGVTTFTSAVSTGDVITVGAGATYGYAVVVGVTSTTLSIDSTDGFVSGITTVPSGTSYFISEEPIYTVVDSVYRAPETKTTGFSTNPVFTSVFGLSVAETEVSRTTTVGGKAGAYGVSHAGWVGVTTYIDMHGNLRVKSETLVAGSSITTDADDDTRFADASITITTNVTDAVGVATDGEAEFSVIASVLPVTSTLTYQWYEDATPLSDGGDYAGTTTSILTVQNDSDKDDGREYSVVIVSGDTSVTSGVGTITYA